MEFLYMLFIAPLEWIMRNVLEWGYIHSGSYGVGLIVMSLVVNTLLLPLYHLAETWQEAERTVQVRMQSQLDRIKSVFQGRERYMMLRTLYRQNKYHPIMAVRTSFGFLIQVPFFFAAFHLLNNYAPLQGVSFGPISDLGAPDAMFFGINVLPFVMTAVNIVSALVYTARLTRRDKIQLYVIAALFLVLLYTSSAGLVFYWTMNNVYSLLKNIVYEKFAIFSHGKMEKNEANKTAPYFVTLKKLSSGFEYQIRMAWAVGILWVTGFLSLIRHMAGAKEYSLEMSIMLLGVASVLQIVVWLFRDKLPNEGKTSVMQAVVLSVFVVAGAFIVAKYGCYQNKPEKLVDRGMVLATIFFVYVWRNKLAAQFRRWAKTVDGQCLNAVSLKALVLIALLVFVYAPVRLVVADAEFGTSTFFAILTWGIVLAVFVPYGIYKLARSHTVKSCAACLFSITAVIFTVYTFFMVKDYGVLDAFMFEHSDRIFDRSYIPVDVAVVSLIILGTIYCFKKKIVIVNKVLGIAILGTFVMTAMPLSKLLQQTETQQATEVAHEDKKYIRLSKTNPNVLVIMLDMFTGDHLGKIRNERPEVLRGFDGFTWYSDTISAGAATVMSVPSIFAGEKVASYKQTGDDQIALEEKIDAEFKSFFETLGQHSYTSKIIASEKIDFIQNKNYVDHALVQVLINKAATKKESQDIANGRFAIKYGLFEALPWSMRTIIYSSGTWGLASLKASRSKEHYEVLNQLSLITQCDNGKSSYVALTNELTHKPWNIDGTTLKPMDGDPYPQTKNQTEMVGDVIPEHYYAELSAMDRLSEYFKWMKENKVYDNTMIVVVSDHGQSDSLPLLKTFGGENVKLTPGIYPGRPVALLLVKPRDASGGLKESEAQMSTTDVRRFVEADIQGQTYVPSLDSRVRYHAIGSWQRERHPENHYKIDSLWKVTGPKLNRESWQEVIDVRNYKN